MNQPPLNPDAVLYAVAALHGDNCPDDPEPGQACDCDAGHYERLAETAVAAYLAVALPEVAEREQLTALPEKIVLEDRRGTIWQKINGNWYTPGSKHDYSDQSVMLPARVLYRPEVKP